MSFLTTLSARIPFLKKEEVVEYFFALNISSEKLTCALWTIEGRQLKILETVSDDYSTLDDLTPRTDKLLDAVLGIREIEPQKILFGVPSSWLVDENLKDEYLKILRGLVKTLELTPMAYVENSHALVHFLEKLEGVPPTAILVGFGSKNLTVTVVRAGKPDGAKTVLRRSDSGSDIEKALLMFTDVETLPSRILIFGLVEPQLKNQLLSFSWMSKLSFLHFPKVDVMQDDVEIKSICLAGASEINPAVIYTEHAIKQVIKRSVEVNLGEKIEEEKMEKERDLGFMVGDISTQTKTEVVKLEENLIDQEEYPDTESISKSDDLPISEQSRVVELEDFEHELPTPQLPIAQQSKKKFALKQLVPKKFGIIVLILGIIIIIGLIMGAYFLLPKVEVKIFVEPKIIENNATVTADPNQKTVDENNKIIPGQVIETEVSDSAKDNATGQKQIGDPAKGTVKIINNSNQAQTLSKGSVMSANSIKFTLDLTTNVASTSAISDSKSTVTAKVTATVVGADGNLPSGTQFNTSNADIAIVAEGNFSGGTSKQVTVVSADDASRLLASLSSTLRQQAQQKLQEKLPQKKILQEALAESIVKKSFSKNINDQASEFSLNLTTSFKGTAFDDADLKLIISKLVTTQVPEGFTLNLNDTETQADVSNLDKDGKLIFLARFKAKLLPKIDEESIKNKIKGKSINDAVNIIKGMDNILGSEIILTPSLPAILQRIPILVKNIKIEVGLK